MSQENVDGVQDMLDAYNRRDLDGMLDLASGDDIVFVNGPKALEGGTRRGREEVSQAMLAQWESFAEGRFEVDRFYDQGDDVIALGRLSVRMAGSESQLVEPFLATYRFRDGKMTRAEVLAVGRGDVDELLDASGLTK